MHAAQEFKLQEFTADIQSEYDRKNCFRIAIQMCFRECWKRESDVRCQLITCSLASCLARELRIPVSSCDKYKENTKQSVRSCTML